jgi:hypothetical protein
MMNAATRPTFDGLKTCEPRCWITYFVSSDSPATIAKMYKSLVPHGSPTCVSVVRRIRATPLPVSIALAGHTNAPLERRVRATSMTAQVRIAARICGIVTRKWSPTWPRMWIEMMHAATWSRGSRMLGRTTG